MVGSPFLRILLAFIAVHSKKIYRAVGRAIRARRQRLSLSQEQLAERADFTRNYIGMIERAEKKVTLEALAKLAKALGVRVRDLVADI